MAKLGRGGDLSNVRDEDMAGGGWTAIEPGEYRALIKETDYKPTKAGDGKCLHLSVLITHGEEKGSELRDFLTLEHPKEETVRIARAKLKQLALAIGHPTPDNVRDSAELERKPMIVKVGIEKARDPKHGDRNGNQNKVYGYASLDELDANEPAPTRGAYEPPHPADAEVPF